MRGNLDASVNAVWCKSFRNYIALPRSKNVSSARCTALSPAMLYSLIGTTLFPVVLYSLIGTTLYHVVLYSLIGMTLTPVVLYSLICT